MDRQEKTNANPGGMPGGHGNRSNKVTSMGCISLLKSNNGLLIPMIHNGGGFFGSYPKPDTLDT